ncbi:MAG: hypothetical protein ACOYB7_16675 [Mycobacterium sp.]
MSLAVTAPLLAPGYLLLRDAVSTPRSYLTDAALGLGEAAPRAVPQDFAIAALSTVIDGGWVVKAVVIVALLLACWGAGRLANLLLPEAGLPGQLVAATLAVWNPYVAERLLQGHWSLLLGYGALPWVAAAVLRLRTGPTGTDRRTDWAALVFWVALAGLTPTGLMLAAVLALVCVTVPGAGVRRLRLGFAVLGIAVAGALPWLAASAVGTALGASQSAGLAPFAARAEPGLGTLGSLAGLGGLWNAEAVPPTRTTLFAVLGTAVLLAVVALGIAAAVRRPVCEPLLMLAAAAVLLPAAMATAPGLAVLRATVEAVPGLAVLRDGQKWVALAMPGYAVAGAGAVLTLRRWVRPGVSAVVCAAALIAVLPDLAWGVGGRIAPVRYPPQWAAVAAQINADPLTVVALPPESMRRFAWAGPAPVLDPLPRWVRADVLGTGDLLVGGQTVPGEGTHARKVQGLLAAGADPATLARAGVGWVLNENQMTLQRVGGMTPGAPHWKRITVILAHLVWAGMLIGAAVRMAAVGPLRLRRSNSHDPGRAGR